jgi:NAD-dependent dihydropyrimidine dehydrogenase PreA subunit
MSQSWMPQINSTLCTGCRECITRCPTLALGSHGGKAALIHPDACTYCGVCEEMCPVGAIELPFMILKCNERGKEA